MVDSSPSRCTVITGDDLSRRFLFGACADRPGRRHRRASLADGSAAVEGNL